MRFVTIMAQLWNSSCEADAAKSEASNPDDMEKIFAVMRQEQGGFAGVNNAISRRK